MQTLFRKMFKDDDLLLLISENDREAELLMTLGQMNAKVIGRTPPSEGPNYTVKNSGKLIEAGKRAQLQIWFSEEKP